MELTVNQNRTDLLAACVHEAGHILVAGLLGVPLREAIFTFVEGISGRTFVCPEWQYKIIHASEPSKYYEDISRYMTVGHAGILAECIVLNVTGTEVDPEFRMLNQAFLRLYPRVDQQNTIEIFNTEARAQLEEVTRDLCVTLLKNNVERLQQISMYLSNRVRAASERIVIPIHDLTEQIGNVAGKYAAGAYYRLECGHTVHWIYGGRPHALACSTCKAARNVVHIVFTISSTGATIRSN